MKVFSTKVFRKGSKNTFLVMMWKASGVWVGKAPKMASYRLLFREQVSRLYIITNDKNMEAQQQLRGRPFAILILSATNWPVIEPHVAKIAEALNGCKPGSVIKVDCGRFRPAKFLGPRI